MTHGELSESQARRSRQFAEAQINAMSVYCDAERDLKELQAENAKLREMVRDYERCMDANCDRCEYYGKLSTHCPLSPCFPDADELCELGVEMEDGTE